MRGAWERLSHTLASSDAVFTVCVMVRSLQAAESHEPIDAGPVEVGAPKSPLRSAPASRGNRVRTAAASYLRTVGRGAGNELGAREALRRNRHLVLRLPAVYRADPVRELAQLRDDDLRFLFSYHEEQAQLAHEELAKRNCTDA